MKILNKVMFVSLFMIFLFNLDSKAQSVQLEPNKLQLPKVAALGACTSAEYGQVVFLTTTNKAQVCSASGWVAVEAASGGGSGTLTLPYTGLVSTSIAGFEVTNNGGTLASVALKGSVSAVVNDASAILGVATPTAPTGFNAGVRGVNNATNQNGFGVYGQHAGTGSGVYGTSATGSGVLGMVSGAGGVGVQGFGTGLNGVGVWGRSNISSGSGGLFENSNATGYALTVTGKMKFSANSPTNGAFLKSTDAVGTTTWSNVNRTEKQFIPAAAFVPHMSENGVVHGSRGVSFSNIVGAGSMHAPVHIPSFANITNVTVYMIDQDATLNASSWSLQKLDFGIATSSYSNITTVTFSTAATNSSSIFQSQQNLVGVTDNGFTFYRIVVSMPIDPDLVLVGASVTYNYQVNN